MARIERRLLAHAVSERCIWADIDQIELDGADAAEFVDLRREGDLDQIAHADRRALRGGGEEDGLKALASASETQAQMLAAADLAQLQNAQPAHGEHRTRAARAAGFEVAQRLNIFNGQQLRRDYPEAKIVGHCQLSPYIRKACPCFDAREEYAGLEEEVSRK